MKAGTILRTFESKDGRDVTPRSGRSKHVGVLGIALKDCYREIGIGTELLRAAETQARRRARVFATNERARHVYGKVGYRDVGAWPRAVKKDDVYIDEIMMSKEVSE